MTKAELHKIAQQVIRRGIRTVMLPTDITTEEREYVYEVVQAILERAELPPEYANGN